MDPAPPRRRFWTLRIGRGHFWLGMAGLVVFTAALAQVWPRSLNISFVAPWMLLHAWRLHDIGRNGLWAVFFLSAVLLVLSWVAMVSPGGLEVDWVVWTGGLALLGLLVFTLAMGVIRGDPGPNRYGQRLGAK